MEKPTNFKINNRNLEFRFEGEKSYGESKVLLQEDDDLTVNTAWKAHGYTIEPFLQDENFRRYLNGIKEFYRGQIHAVTEYDPEFFRLEDYHKLVKSQEQHLEVVKRTTQLSYEYFPIPVQEVIDRISDILKIKLTITNPYNKFERFHFRTIRPNSQDFNPLHRDAWLDRLRNGINLYVPIAGSNAHSSLGVIPGSHLWPESQVERTLDGSIVNNVKYQVPALTGSKVEFEVIRPNPGYNEVLIFSPYLIHGGGANFNEDETRVSMEMRLWRK